MRILVLEDNEMRIESFHNMVPTGVDYAKTAQDAIQKLQSNKYNLIFLDHDLGDQTMVESGIGTGYEVAKYIHDQQIWSEVIIHSWNSIGAENIKSVLPHALYIPFGGFIINPTYEHNELLSVSIDRTGK